MSPLNSSISNSDRVRFLASTRRRGWSAFGWTLVWLAVIDFVAGVVFAYPQNPREIRPNPLALYFDYGRSMEGRLRRATRPDPSQTAPITLAGWYHPLDAVERPAEPDAAVVTIYGMSHAVRLADALQESNPGRYRVRSIGAPGATTNWAYGAFLRDAQRSESKVAVLAIMSSTLPMILSPTPMDWNASFAMPYTADRFFVDVGTGQLDRIRPPYESFNGYVQALEYRPSWNRALRQFAKTDPFYDPSYVRESWLDESVIIRLARRGLSQRRDRAWRGRVLDGSGYSEDSEPVRVANAIVTEFAGRARSERILPVIYIVDSFGYGNQLTRSLEKTLMTRHIPFLSSSRFVDPRSPVNYLPDSHFTHANDILLARALDDIINKNLGTMQNHEKSTAEAVRRDGLKRRHAVLRRAGSVLRLSPE